MKKGLLLCILICFIVYGCSIPGGETPLEDTGNNEAAGPFANALPAKQMFRSTGTDKQGYINLALGKANMTSSRFSANHGGDKALDGNNTTAWGSESDNTNKPEWIYVDLGQNFTIHNITIRWFGSFYAQSFEVYVSNDMKSWIKVYSEDMGQGADTALYGSIECRYVGVLCLSKNDAAYGITELEVCRKAGTPVIIPDANLESVIRNTISKPTGDILDTDLMDITELKAMNQGITTIEGLEHCTNVAFLNLGKNAISDLTPLSGLARLKILRIYNNPVSDLTPVAALRALTELNAEHCSITDISALKDLLNLRFLMLSYNAITDIGPLQNLIKLEALLLYSNEISVIDVIGGLTAIYSLDVSFNKLSDISCLKNLTKLKYLKLYSNQISDVTPLADLIYLEVLGLSINKVSDIGPLRKLTRLTCLGIPYNNISDITPIRGFPDLEVLRVSGNPLTEIDTLGTLTNLSELYISRTGMSDLSPLTTLTKLTRFQANQNGISDISVFKSLPMIKRLDLQYNAIKDLSALSNVSLDELFITYNNMDISPDTPQGMANRDVLARQYETGCVLKWIAGNITSNK